MHWTGIGTRGFLPQKVINRQVAFARLMASQKHELWTGGALQSDYNFLYGACSHSTTRQNNARQHVVRSVGMERFTRPRGALPKLHLCEEVDLAVAVEYYLKHGIFKEEFFEKADPITRALHARNFYQVMESATKARSELVVYASKEDRWRNVSGGTRSAVAVARIEGISDFNIRTEEGWANLVAHVENNKIVPKGVLK